MIDRFCALANNGEKRQHISYPELSIDRDNQALILHKFNLIADKPIIAFCPAAEYGPAKRWLPEHFAALADMLCSKGYQVVVLGSDKDTVISQTIIELLADKSQIFDLCGKTNLTDAIDVLGAATYVVTNDSGLMHIACAVGVNVVAVYGSSSPGFTPPLSKHAQLIQLDLDCSPCFQRTCRFGHYNCLRFITPYMVLERINTIVE
jgi:heptosyltransferase-2